MENVIQIFSASEIEAAQAQQNVSYEPESYLPTLTEPRTSHYTIYADLPENDDEMVIVHGYLGHRALVSKEVANYLRSKESKSPPRPLYGEWTDPDFRSVKVPEPPAKVKEMLLERGFLTRRSYSQELSFFKQYVERKARRSARQMPFYLFMPTYDCNLRCPYCFQDHMRKDESFRPFLKLMSKETVDRIFAAMPDIEKRHGYDASDIDRHRDISFFGGEPLLKQNREIVQYIMEKAKEVGSATFSATSNCTEIDAYADLLGEGLIEEIQVTLDGMPEEHDKRRIYPDGSGSFALIAKNISLGLEKGVRMSVRLNVDYNNVNDLPALAQLIKDYGWDKHSNFGVYLAPIRAANEDTDEKICMSTRQLNEELRRLRKEHPSTLLFTVDGDKMFAKAKRIFETPQDEGAGLKTQYCAAHSRMYLFDALADIYACWEQTGDKKIRIGTINKHAGLLMNQSEELNWRSRSVASNPICSQCRYAMHCGGGCAIVAAEKTGTLHSNDCDSYGKRFRSSVAEAFLASQKKPA